MSHPHFAHYAAPWNFTTVNGREIAVSLGEIAQPAVHTELAYLAVREHETIAATTLTADELTALIDQLTITRNAMKGES